MAKENVAQAKIIKLLPFSPDASFRDRENGVSLRSAAGGEAISEKTALSFDRDYVYEPNAYSLFEALLSEYISNQICHGILESRSAEEMSRMLAMKSASENADEMIGKLKLDYNKTRQAQITKELTEVISAAEAAA